MMAPRASAETSWAGPYVGLNGGLGWGQASTSFGGEGDGGGVFGSGFGSGDEASDGVFNQELHREIVGLQAGFNEAVWNQLYGGLEVQADGGGLRAEADNYLRPVENPGDTTADVLRIKSLISVTPQIGYGLGRFFARLKGGAAAGDVSSYLYSTGVAEGGYLLGKPPVTFNQSHTALGWTIGLGADYALAEHWTAGLAYDYYDFGHIQFGGQSSPNTEFPLAYVVHPIVSTLTARLGYKF